MIVEFFGTPGAGKTTTIKRLSSQHDLYWVQVRSKSSVLVYATLFMCRHPLITIFWVDKLVRHGAGMFRYKAALFVRSCAITMKAHMVEKRHHLVIIDEGLLQRSLSIWETVFSEQDTHTIFNHIVTADTYVVFTEGDFARFTKTDDAHNSPRFKKGATYLQQWTPMIQSNVLSMIEHIKNTHTAYVYDVSFEKHAERDQGLMRELHKLMR